MDIQASKREKFIEAVRKYFESIGGELTSVATFGTETSKAALQTACFVKDTPVLTKNGEKSIQDITSKDYVLTSNGYEKVITPTVSTTDALVRIRNRNSVEQDIYATPEHEFLVVTTSHKGRIDGKFNRILAEKYFPETKYIYSQNRDYEKMYNYCRNAETEWVQAKDLRAQMFGLKLIDLSYEENKFFDWDNSGFRYGSFGIKNHIEVNNDFCELIGFWLAEGSINKNSVTFTIHQKETYFRDRIILLMYKVFGIDNYSLYTRQDSLGLNIQFSSSQLVKAFLDLFEANSPKEINQWHKYIPKILKNINPKIQLQIFKGWFIGDGYARLNGKGGESKGTTVSKQLAKDMIEVLNRNFIQPYVLIERRENYKNTGNLCTTYNIMLYAKKAIKLYKLKYESDLSEELNFNFFDLGSIDIPIFLNGNVYLKTVLEVKEAIDLNKSQEVYCLKVPSQNFTVCDTIVHNCRGLGYEPELGTYLSSLIPIDRKLT